MSDSRRGEFVDSNVLIYAHDVSAGGKRLTARALLDRLWRERCGCLSVQVLQEFVVNVTRKVPKPIPIPQAQDLVTALGDWTVHCPTPADVAAALDRQSRHRISFWDAMILESAERLDCGVLWSEDLSSGQLYDGIEVCNPFAETGPISDRVCRPPTSTSRRILPVRSRRAT